MKRALAAAMLSALATGAVLATVGFGANSTATTSKKKSSKSAQATQSGPPKTMKQVYDEQQVRRAAQEKKLADALGVSVEQLTTAQDKLQKDRLDAQVKANTLTQAQADAILACADKPLTCDRSNLPAGGPGGPRGPHGKPGKGGISTFAADLAKALGIDQAKVESALQSTRPARPARGGMPTAGGMPSGGGLPGRHDGHGPGGHGGPGGPGGPGGYGGGFDGAGAIVEAAPLSAA